MTVIPFIDFRPSPRFPPVTTPWTGVEIAEGTSSKGPFSVIDTITFDTPDTDPTDPQLRSFSTQAATLDAGWYLVTFLDADGNRENASPVAYPLDPTSPLAPGMIATLDELKDDLGKTKSIDDARLGSILLGVQQRVESYCGRLFHPVPALDPAGDDTASPVVETVYLPRRYWTPWRPPRQVTLQIPDAREILDVSAVDATITGWQSIGDPPWRRLRLFGLSIPEQFDATALPAVEITGRFGIWPAPADIKDAVLTMASRRWREKDASYGDTVQLPEGGIVSYFRQFPPSVQATLDLYRRTVRLP